MTSPRQRAVEAVEVAPVGSLTLAMIQMTARSLRVLPLPMTG
jgi:hypothetical protein